MSDLSKIEVDLLLALKRGRHFKANPAKPADLLSIAAEDANPTGRRLIKLGLAARVLDDERRGALLLRITDDGISEADKLRASLQKPTIRQRIKKIPIGRGVWDVLLVVLGAALGVVGAKIFL